MSLFSTGDFYLHSGQKSKWKIDCDWLTDDDISTCALMLSEKLAPFCVVRSVPTGGDRIAEAMRQYVDTSSNTLLIVDDVFTTGKSIEEMRKQLSSGEGIRWRQLMGITDTIGAVIFARNSLTQEQEEWITPLFRMMQENEENN